MKRISLVVILTEGKDLYISFIDHILPVNKHCVKINPGSTHA